MDWSLFDETSTHAASHCISDVLINFVDQNWKVENMGKHQMLLRRRRRRNVRIVHGWIQSVGFNFWERKRQKRKEILYEKSYQSVWFTVETLANCVVGQMWSLEYRCKKRFSFHWSGPKLTKWTKVDQNGPNGLKWLNWEILTSRECSKITKCRNEKCYILRKTTEL